MDFHVTPLRSGSSGNLTLVSHGGTILLVDAGLQSQRSLSAALTEAGCAWSDVNAVLASHLHCDHVNHNVAACCAKHNVPIHIHRENIDGFTRKILTRTPARAPLQPFHDDEAFSIGTISVRPFRVPHDAHGVTCGFSLTSVEAERNIRVTMATDLGCSQNGLFEEFIDSDLILIEANYDENLLSKSRRLDKNRVSSNQGHMSNIQTGKFLVRVLQESRKMPSAVVLCHLSRDHNTPRLALNTVREILSGDRFDGIPIHAARWDAATARFSV